MAGELESWRYVVALAALSLVAGCGAETRAGDDAASSDAGVASDAAAACEDRDECSSDPYQLCEEGRCTTLCDVSAGESACNVGPVSDFPPICCGAGEHCCEYSFERATCYDRDQPCPEIVLCPRGSGANDLCRDGYCAYVAPAPEADGGLRDAGAAPDAGGAAACVKYRGDCVDDCPPEDQCGDECCGRGTRCEDGCCVVDR